MNNAEYKNAETAQERLQRWREMHPEMTDQEFVDAIEEIKSYLRLAWRIYRAKHKDENLPDEL